MMVELRSASSPGVRILLATRNDAKLAELRRLVDGRVRLDLPYEEDSRAEVDMNVVATDTGTLVEVQGTGEGATYTRATLDAMLDSALAGCARLTELQTAALAEPYPGELP